MFFFYSYGAPRDLHSFPTRRSSDLGAQRGARCLHALGPLVGAGVVRQASRALRLADRRRPHETPGVAVLGQRRGAVGADRKSTRLNSSHVEISYAVFCLKKKKKKQN